MWTCLRCGMRDPVLHPVLLSLVRPPACTATVLPHLYLPPFTQGMEYCHGKRVTHWNLKAGNLVVGFSGDKVPLCKVADVGLSRPRQLAALDEAGVGRVLPWAAPELVRDPAAATEKVRGCLCG